MDKSELTDFGYQKVSAAEKTNKVAEVFRSVAGRYDIMNDLMSFGIHRLWKRSAVELAGVRAGQSVLDLAGGTGDLAKRFAEIVGERGQVVLADINDAMLARGRERLTDAGVLGNISYAQVNAECLPFADASFDCITIAFGLRNVTDKIAALQSCYRVLRPGGCLLILEFSQPILPGLKPIYDAYSFSILPVLGKIIAKDSASYRYLAESIRRHPDQKTLLAMLQSVGFERCDYHNLSGGIVAIHRGYKL